MEFDLTRISAAAAISDRLGSTLFLAALVHGVVILGVTFTAVTFDDDPLTVAQRYAAHRRRGRAAPPDKTDFLANRKQPGGGRRREGPAADDRVVGRTSRSRRRATPTARTSPTAHPRARHPSAEQLVSRSPSIRAGDRPFRSRPRTADMRAEGRGTGRSGRAADPRRRARTARRATERPTTELVCDAEHAAIGSRRVPGRLAAASRADRHGELSRANFSARFDRTADARGHDSAATAHSRTSSCAARRATERSIRRR